MSNNHHFGYEEHGGDLEVEVNATMGSEVVGTRDNVYCSIYTSPLNILGNHNEWPCESARFFIRDHKNQGGRLRGLVFNSVINSKINSDLSSLTVRGMFFHLHIASIRYAFSTTNQLTPQL